MEDSSVSRETAQDAEAILAAAFGSSYIVSSSVVSPSVPTAPIAPAGDDTAAFVSTFDPVTPPPITADTHPVESAGSSSAEESAFALEQFAQTSFDATDAPAVRRRPESRVYALASAVLSRIKRWFIERGVYWTGSAVAHAVVLLGTLVLLGNIVTPKFHSVAPFFEGQVDTQIPASEFEAIDNADVQLEPTDATADQLSLVSSDTQRLDNLSQASTGNATGDGVGGGSDAGSAMDAGVGMGTGGAGLGIAGISGPGARGGGGGSNLRSLAAIDPSGGGRGGPQRSSARHGGVVQAAGVGDAIDGVIGGIRGELEKGDLLVCWLADSSISLLDDRQIIAERIEPFFKEVEQRSKNSFKLMNAVVAFGGAPLEIVKPTKFNARIVEAIRKLPIDPSGIENVMSAVQYCVDLYGKRWQGGMLIVLWTDESGDDILKLEEVIRMCRKRHIVLRIVGPSAVLGSDRGMHYWADKRTGQAYRLPVKRGPDTVLPEKLFIPYWHDAALPPWISGGAQVAAGMPWYGGPHREGVLSGIGPYALTRLALETGGKFTLLDHKEDQGPFSLAKMRRYLPDYESLDAYLAMLEKYPLRKAVSTAVQRTYHKVNLVPPITTFVLSRSTSYPHQIIANYQPPPVFRQLLFDELPRQEHLAHIGSQVIEEALAAYGKEGMEYEYMLERSPRWRAWYDLNRGRLLAMSVRHLEYILTLEQIRTSNFLNPETNRIELVPVARYKAGNAIAERAKEAFRLLTRCKKDNADTPWALLAQWELDHELGLDVKQIVIPAPPPPKPAPPGRPAPPTYTTPQPPLVIPNL